MARAGIHRHNHLVTMHLSMMQQTQSYDHQKMKLESRVINNLVTLVDSKIERHSGSRGAGSAIVDFFNSQLGTTADSYRNSDFLTSGTRRVTLHRESVSLRKKRKMTDENKKGRAKGYCTRKKRKGRKKTDWNCSTSKFT